MSMNSLTEKAVRNYERDIKRFSKAAKQWPQDRRKYLQAVHNLQCAVEKMKAGTISL